MRTKQIFGIACILMAFSCPVFADPQVQIEPGEDRYTVRIDGKVFTEYLVTGRNKPILYPVIGPTGAGMTRNWPIADAAEGEAKDHPHHESLWYTHGNVNGVDYWMNGRGVIKHLPEMSYIIESEHPILLTHSHWMGTDGKPVMLERRETRFSATDSTRVIDFSLTFTALRDVTFGDTKEGSMGIRTNPKLRIDRGATAINSEGESGKSIWGKRAKWVDYSAEIDGAKVGVAIFDHPSNPRHPTWWHAREYGLVAANPFGVHDFERKERGAGDMKLPAGQSVRFKYRFVFHKGDANEADVKKLFEQYAAEGDVARGEGESEDAEVSATIVRPVTQAISAAAKLRTASATARTE